MFGLSLIRTSKLERFADEYREAKEMLDMVVDKIRPAGLNHADVIAFLKTANETSNPMVKEVLLEKIEHKDMGFK